MVIKVAIPWQRYKTCCDAQCWNLVKHRRTFCSHTRLCISWLVGHYQLFRKDCTTWNLIQFRHVMKLDAELNMLKFRPLYCATVIEEVCCQRTALLTNVIFFYVLLTVHFSNIWFHVFSNLMHPCLLFFHIPLHVSSHIVLIIRRNYCIHTASGSLSLFLGDRSVHRQCLCTERSPKKRDKEPDAVCIQ